MIHVRPAVPRDADTIASINVRSWHASYRGIMPDAHLAALNAANMAPQVREVIISGKGTVLVAETPDVRGYCWFTKSRDDDAPDGTGELVSVYVAPDFERRGIGRCLLLHCHATARHLGFTHSTLWALDQNHRAHAFYEAMGYVPDGSDKTTTRWGGTTLRQVRFARTL